MSARPRPLVPNWLLGLAVALVVGTAFALALAGELPWRGGYELKAVFSDAKGMRVDSPVRIAGVDVGEVTAIEHVAGAAPAPAGTPPGAALVTMRIDDEGRPVRTDAALRIRPRLFLEGNYFIELRPGSPSAPEAEDGFVVPSSQTASPVQLDEVLSGLQYDVRADLRTFLDELGGALARHGGAQGLNELLRSAPESFRPSARVSLALLGREPHDLSRLVGDLEEAVGGLARRPARLRGLVTHLDRVAGALATGDRALGRAVARLPAAISESRGFLATLDASLPATRAFAVEARPGIERLVPAIEAATPLLEQLRGLVSPDELRGLAADARLAVPRLALLAERTPPFLDEARALSSCFNEVVIPWANMTVPDPETPASGRIFEETSYGLVGIAGESRSGDANGPYARVLGGAGTNTVVYPPAGGATDELVGIAPLPILGARPALDSSAKPPFRPDVACETNAPPSLDSGDAAPAPEQRPLSAPAGTLAASAGLRERLARLADRLRERPGGHAPAALDRLLARELGWRGLATGAGR